jgi:excisionase family DNA binding protein
MTAPGAIKERGLLSTGQVAEKLNVHRSTVWQWINTGALPAKRVGQRYMGVDPDDLERFEKIYVQDVSVGVSSVKPASSEKTKKARGATTKRKKK